MIMCIQYLCRISDHFFGKHFRFDKLNLFESLRHKMNGGLKIFLFTPINREIVEVFQNSSLPRGFEMVYARGGSRI